MTEILLAAGVFLLVFAVLRALSRGGAAATSAEELPVTEDSVRQALMQGRKIQAIKIYRRLHGVDLREAKDAVEQLALSLPPRP